MTTTAPATAGQSAGNPAPGRTPTRRVPFAVAAVASMLGGLVAAVVLVLVVFAGAGEAVITGAGLVGLACGWALLAVLTTRFTGQPQRWAAVPAAVMASTGLVLLTARPGPGVLTAAGWLWPPAGLALAAWTARAARRATTGRAGWLLYPVIALIAVTAVGGAVETLTLARDTGRYPMPGARYDVGGHRLHLVCAGTGSPTVVLENGLNETSALWDAVLAQVSRRTRVCAYDRAGQGFSDDPTGPQDGRTVATDLHTLLARAGEHPPYLLAGHSVGGTLALTYAARYPTQVAGLVLLDSSSPHQYTDQPAFPRTYTLMRRLLPVLPTLARTGALHLAPAPPAGALSPAAAAQARAFTTSPRGATNLRDEQAQLPTVFRQAQALTSFDPRPLAVVTSRENAEGITGWTTDQDKLAALSTNSTHWTADTTHLGLLEDTHGTAHSIRAITAVISAIRTGTPVTAR